MSLRLAAACWPAWPMTRAALYEAASFLEAISRSPFRASPSYKPRPSSNARAASSTNFDAFDLVGRRVLSSSREIHGLYSSTLSLKSTDREEPIGSPHAD